MLYYIAIINLISFFYMGFDKFKDIRRMWRVPEMHFFVLSFLGGALGVLLAMQIFRHKTLHPKFKYGVPALLILNIAVLLYAKIKLGLF